jgi:predicted Fe-Mo cluster-binding NifX family protein
MGPRLVADLAAQGIDAYLCAATDIHEAANQFAGGTLRRVAGGCCNHQ